MKRRDFFKIFPSLLLAGCAGEKSMEFSEKPLQVFSHAYIPPEYLKEISKEELYKKFKEFFSSLNLSQKMSIKICLHYLNIKCLLKKGKTFHNLSDEERIQILEKLYHSHSRFDRAIVQMVRMLSFVSLYSTNLSSHITKYRKTCEN